MQQRMYLPPTYSHPWCPVQGSQRWHLLATWGGERLLDKDCLFRHKTQRSLQKCVIWLGGMQNIWCHISFPSRCHSREAVPCPILRSWVYVSQLKKTHRVLGFLHFVFWCVKIWTIADKKNTPTPVTMHGGKPTFAPPSI